MIVISLFVHIQHCLERYRTRKSLAQLTSQQMLDIGMTKDCQRIELSQASVFGLMRELMSKNKRRPPTS